MTKVDIVERLHIKLRMNKKEASDLLETVLELIKNTLVSGEDIKIQGFGNFEVKQKNDRNGRNPQNGEAITIEARKIVTFKISALLKAKINNR